MNIIATLLARIESYRETNKQPCKNYATEAAAEKAVKAVAEEVAEHHGCKQSARYLVVYNEAWGRWVGAIDLTELLNRRDANGGYLGLACDRGFFTY